MPDPTELTGPIAITGAAGALGTHVLGHLLRHGAREIRALVHDTPLPMVDARIVPCRGSLLDPASLARWVAPRATVIHLAFPKSLTAEQHLRAMDNLIDVCSAAGVRRLVHCSTAVVVGRTSVSRVTEDTPCHPVTAYEHIKLDLERRLLAAAADRLAVVIVRPTAIFGTGLKNLEKLARDSQQAPAIVNWLRASLFGQRPMHLVPVETVAAAILFVALTLSDAALIETGPRFIVSADLEPGGSFRAVEARMRKSLGLRRTVPPLPVPRALLRFVLRRTGRSDDPSRLFDGSKLQQAGFTPPVRLQDAIDAWATRHARGPRGETRPVAGAA